MSRRKKKGNSLADIPNVEIHLSCDEILKDINQYDYKKYPAFSTILENLLPYKNTLKRFVCLGLGDLCTQYESRKQMAFILGLRKEINENLPILYYEFVPCKTCSEFLTKYLSNIEIETENKVGQYDAANTCFIEFHVPFFLLNNLVLYNLTKEKISDFFLIGNSFQFVYNTQLQYIMPKILESKLIEEIQLDFLNDSSYDKINLMKCNKEMIDEAFEKYSQEFNKYEILPQNAL